ACNTYTWIDGNTYTSSNNTATFTTTNTAGCDSVVTLDLTLMLIDNTVTQPTTGTLTANLSGATYQWIDCDNGNAIIPGAINQTYTVTSSGNYAVIITDAGCSGTSACTNVILTSIESVSSIKSVNIYPNPTTGNTFVNLNDFKNAEISITDLTGKLLFHINNKNESIIELPTTDFSKGVYFVKVYNNKQQQVVKLIKN
ncbi:MAG: T9SS type A sorting domain-containing protein, partial [Vicingaceae bacterium]